MPQVKVSHIPGTWEIKYGEKTIDTPEQKLIYRTNTKNGPQRRKDTATEVNNSGSKNTHSTTSITQIVNYIDRQVECGASDMTYDEVKHWASLGSVHAIRLKQNMESTMQWLAPEQAGLQQGYAPSSAPTPQSAYPLAQPGTGYLEVQPQPREATQAFSQPEQTQVQRPSRVPVTNHQRRVTPWETSGASQQPRSPNLMPSSATSANQQEGSPSWTPDSPNYRPESKSPPGYYPESPNYP